MENPLDFVNFGLLFLEYQTWLMPAEYPICKVGATESKDCPPLFPIQQCFFCPINYILEVWFFSCFLLKVQNIMAATFLLKANTHLPYQSSLELTASFAFHFTENESEFLLKFKFSRTCALLMSLEKISDFLHCWLEVNHTLTHMGIGPSHSLVGMSGHHTLTCYFVEQLRVWCTVWEIGETLQIYIIILKISKAEWLLNFKNEQQNSKYQNLICSSQEAPHTSN